MTSINIQSAARWLAGCVLAAAAVPAFAVSTWNFAVGSGCTDPSSTAAFGNTYTCTGGSPTATATAWSTSGTGATFATAYLSPNGSAGFGVKNQTETLNVTQPDHALDNNGQTDVMLLSFAANSPVALSSISLGYANTDSDVSILRYTGSSAPVMAGNTIGSLLTSGWQLVGNYADLTSAGAANTINSTGLSSSWWLISAYNASYGTSGKDTGVNSASPNLSAGNDYIKVLSVAGTPTSNGPGAPGVPEPGSLALVGAALAGAVWTRRRKAATH